MVAIHNPTRQPITPFKMEPAETEVTMLMPNMAKAKYSGFENVKATWANNGAKQIRQRMEKTPPKVEAVVEIDKARPG